mgnify:CR=1 FL=1
MLGYGLEHHTWEIAEEFLCYRTKGPGLVSNDDIDIALKMRRREKRRPSAFIPQPDPWFDPNFVGF